MHRTKPPLLRFENHFPERTKGEVTSHKMLQIGSQLTQAKVSRAGVIPYTRKDNQLYFLLAKDKRTGELSDFGGGIKIHREVAMAGALREFKEETNDLFGDLYDKINYFSNKIAIVDDSMAILFIPISNIWLNDAAHMFEKRKNQATRRCQAEVESLIWIDECGLRRLLASDRKPSSKYVTRNDILWIRIRNFINKVSMDDLLRALNGTFTL